MNIYRCEDLMLEPALEFGIILNGILRKEPLLQNLDSDAPERIAGVKDFMQKLKAENVCSELNDIIERRTKWIWEWTTLITENIWSIDYTCAFDSW